MSAKQIAHLRLKLNHRKRRIRRWAAEELVRIGKAAVPALMEALTDEKKRVRLWAALALVAIGKEAKDAVPVLMEAQKLVDVMQRREKKISTKDIGNSSTYYWWIGWDWRDCPRSD